MHMHMLMYKIIFAQVIGKLVEGYQSMTPMLRKVEEAICGTNGGRCPKLAAFYAHWERAIFHALNALVLRGTRSMTAMLSDSTDELQRGSPLFKVCQHILSVLDMLLELLLLTILE